MTAVWKSLEVDVRDRVAVVTLRRSAVLNAVDIAAARELLAAATYLASQPHVRVVAVRGEGRAFCTGIDLKELSSGDLPFEYFEVWERALRTFESMDKIVVVGMHGYALGGGLQLALAADVRTSTPTCMLGLPAIKESLVPGLGIWRLPRVVGVGRARELVISGRNVTGAEAHGMGLVDRLIDDLDEGLDAVVQELLAGCSQGTLASKRLMVQLHQAEYERALRTYLDAQFGCYWGADGAEARRAYLTRSTPQWL